MLALTNSASILRGAPVLEWPYDQGRQQHPCARHGDGTDHRSWIAEGLLLPQAVPGTILGLLPLPEPTDDGVSLSDVVVAERDREHE
jgi:hypothetical protein